MLTLKPLQSGNFDLEDRPARLGALQLDGDRSARREVDAGVGFSCQHVITHS